MSEFKSKDDHIIYLLNQGDEKAISIMFEEYFRLLVNISFELVSDREVAKDIVQDLFFNIWKKRKLLILKKPIKPYLSRSVVNLSYNYIRNESKLKTIPITGIDKYKIQSGGTLTDIEYKELQNLIQTGIKNLPYKNRIAFLLHRKSGMSYKEIAKCLNISEKAVEKRISGAIKLLRNFLSPLLKSILIALWLR